MVIRAKNRGGALAKCSQAITDAEANMFTGSVTAPSRSSIATLSFFADITDAAGGLPELKRRLQNIDVTESVDAIAAEDHFMVDRQHFPVQWAGRKAVIMRAEALNEMLNRLWTVFGTGAATIIDQMVEAICRHSAKRQSKTSGRGPRRPARRAHRHLHDPGVRRRQHREEQVGRFPCGGQRQGAVGVRGQREAGAPQEERILQGTPRGFMSRNFNKYFEVSEAHCLTDGDDVCSFRLALAEASEPRMAAMVSERGP